MHAAARLTGKCKTRLLTASQRPIILLFLAAAALAVLPAAGCGGTQSSVTTVTVTVPPGGDGGGNTTTKQQDSNTPSRTVSSDQQLIVHYDGDCTALAPAGWTMTANADGTGVDMSSADGGLYAGWGIAAINRYMQPYYGDLYGDPQTSMDYLAGTIASQYFYDDSGMGAAGEPQMFDSYFYRQDIASAATRGLIYYRLYPTGGNDYIESVYFAMGRSGSWQNDMKLAANVAASIRCTSQLRPMADTSPSYSSDTGSQDDGADGLSNSTYNVQLGTEYDYNPETGENYWVSPGTDYVDGPQGYGAYVVNGNDYVKLEPGRSDW